MTKPDTWRVDRGAMPPLSLTALMMQEIIKHPSVKSFYEHARGVMLAWHDVACPHFDLADFETIIRMAIEDVAADVQYDLILALERERQGRDPEPPENDEWEEEWLL